MFSGGTMRAGVAALVALCVSALAATALGVGTKKERTVSFTNGEAAARATCPSGRRAFAGGFTTSGDIDPVAKRSIRAGKRGWKALMQSDRPGGRMTVIAYCEREGEPLGQLTTRTRTKVLPGGNEFTAVRVRCPAGKTPVSGGFNGGGGGDPYPMTSRRRGKRGWIVRFFTFQPGSRGKVQVNCWDGPPLQARAKTRTIFANPSTSRAYHPVAATCRGDGKAISGGFQMATPFSGNGPVVQESRRSPSRASWVNLFSYRPVATIKVKSYVYCR